MGVDGDARHLAGAADARALVAAGHAAAGVCIVIGLALGVLRVTAAHDPSGWAATGLMAAMGAALVLAACFRVPVVLGLYLVVGTAAIVFVTPMVVSTGGVLGTPNNSVLALPRVALVLVGGSASGMFGALAWAGAGWALGEIASFVVVAAMGTVYELNVAALFTLFLVAILRGYDALVRRTAVDADGRARRYTVRDEGAGQRHLLLADLEGRAAARLYDTVIGYLDAIGDAGSGPVPDRFRVGIRRDLAAIAGADWVRAIERAHGEAVSARPSPRSTAEQVLPEAFAAAAVVALDIQLTGDPSVIDRLGPERRSALDAAVAQCLTNVARHAGVGVAEIAIGRGGGEVTVAVIDSGHGFREQDVAPDRLGLRTSIRARVEQVGGTVRLWSTDAVGTTVVLVVPEGGS